MRLLIITQKVDQDDTVLGYFHRWLEEFAMHFDAVEVVCLFAGTHSLPANVAVHTLGKEEKASRLQYLSRLYTYAIKNVATYDAVLVHMNPEYLVLLGWWWKWQKKKTALWYVHRQVNLKLRVATVFADVIFSSTPYSFRIRSKKARFIGHGIETERFINDGRNRERVPLIVSVGRLTPIKNLETIIEASALLAKRLGSAFTLSFIGEPAVATDVEYAKRMRSLVDERGLSGTITFAGSVPYGQIPEWYARASVSINAVPPGGLDKAVIESAAAGCIPVTSNSAYAGSFGPYADMLTFKTRDAAALADRLEAILREPKIEELRSFVSEMARERFSVRNVVYSIAEGIKEKNNEYVRN